ncbi:MAG: EAL domain-containing protein, partial [Proteobacteria bacterium]|nr:EAL domain-containing protein [Pseudomonadota bacterium]
AQNKAWQDAGHRAVRVSVNVSTRQFVHHDLRRTVETALEKSGLEPRYLELEITESLMIDDDQQAAQTLRELRELGILISLDDFGTGYSSLSYITRFPLDSIKIDRCFVQDVDSDPAAAGVVTAVIEMAHSLGLRVVAEGVESEPVAAFLRERGCDEMQGFLLSPAVSPEAFAQFLVRERD